jgi:Cupin-like domain
MQNCDTSYLPKIHRSVQRRQGLSIEEVYADHLSGHGEPVILTDAIKAWPALSKWNFQFFRERYGEDFVFLSGGVYGTSKRLTSLRQFLDYVDAPSRRPGGFWIDNVTKLPRPETAEDTAAPLRLYDQNAFLRHAELLEDIKPAPHCIEDWLALLPDNFQKLLQGTRYHPRLLIIGPEGSKTHLHYDFLHSCGSLAQIIGSKRCILFPPTDSAFLYDRDVDPEHPDLQRFPLFERATAFCCTLNPGELLLIPRRWWHHLSTVQTSITVAYTFFNRANFPQYFTSLFKHLPQILDDFSRIPGWQEQLGVKWDSRDFGFNESRPGGDDPPSGNGSS